MLGCLELAYKHVSYQNSAHAVTLLKPNSFITLFCSLPALPVFVVAPQNETILHSKFAMFQCFAKGPGKISVKWYKDGHLLQRSDAAARIFIVGPRLFIVKSYYSDAGKYSCQASNEAGMVQADAYLRVITKERRGRVA